MIPTRKLAINGVSILSLYENSEILRFLPLAILGTFGT
jgi:hypothetical protein